MSFSCLCAFVRFCFPFFLCRNRVFFFFMFVFVFVSFAFLLSFLRLFISSSLYRLSLFPFCSRSPALSSPRRRIPFVYVKLFGIHRKAFLPTDESRSGGRDVRACCASLTAPRPRPRPSACVSSPADQSSPRISIINIYSASYATHTHGGRR